MVVDEEEEMEEEKSAQHAGTLIDPRRSWWRLYADQIRARGASTTVRFELVELLLCSKLHVHPGNSAGHFLARISRNG